MEYLVDTHALIRFMNGDTSLSPENIARIKNEANYCYVSIASIWEIAIKINLGKLEIKIGFGKIADFLIKNELKVLPIEFDHLQVLLKLELIHRDPFDRVIIAQGVSQDFTIITRDENFAHYPVKCIW